MVNIDMREVKRLNLIRLLEKKGWKPKDLAQKIGKSTTLIYNLISAPDAKNHRNIGHKTLTVLASAFNVEENEFRRVDVMGLPMQEPASKGIPVISWVQAGDFTEAIDLWPVGVSGEGEPVTSRVKVGPHAFALVVNGDSMMPRYFDGDIIIVDPGVRCENGDKCVVKINDEVTFKIYKENEKEIRLEPMNDRYDIRTIKKGSRVDFKIIGKVVDMKPKIY